MAISKAVVATILLVLLSGVNSIGSDCGDASFHVKFATVTLQPDPPIAGVSASLVGNGTINEAFTGGSSTLVAYLDTIPVFTSPAFNACGPSTVVLPLSFGNVGINAPPCPIAAGSSYNVSMTILLPAGVPSGAYQVIVSSMDQAQGNGYCLNASFSL